MFFLAACTVSFICCNSSFASSLLSTSHPLSQAQLSMAAEGPVGPVGPVGPIGPAGVALGFAGAALEFVGVPLGFAGVVCLAWRFSGCGFTCGMEPHVFFGFDTGSSVRRSSTTGFSNDTGFTAGAAVLPLRVLYPSQPSSSLTSSSWISFSDRTRCGVTFFHVAAFFT